MRLLILTLCFLSVCIHSIVATEKTTYLNQHIDAVEVLYHQSDSLIDAGNFDAACNISKQNLETFLKQYGSASIEYSFALYKHANNQFEYGMMQSCDTLINKSQQINNAIDSTNLLAARILYLQCEIGEQFGRGQQQVVRAERMNLLFEKHLGSGHPDFAHSLEVLGNLLAYESRFEEAIEALHRSISILENYYGSDSPELWRSYCYLGNNYVRIFDTDLALEYLDKSIELLETSYGPDYWQIGKPLERKSLQLFDSSKLNEAVEMIKKSIALKRKHYPKDHQEIIGAEDLLFIYYLKMGKYDLAEPIMLSMKTALANMFGDKSPIMHAPLNNLGVLYKYQGRYQEGADAIAESLELIGVDSSMRTALKHNLADLYVHLEEYEKAKELLDQVIPFRINQFHPKHKRVAYSLALLGDLYMGMNEFSQAESLYLEVNEIYKNSYDKISNRIVNINMRISKLYLKYNMFQKSEPYAQTAFNVSKQLYHMTNPFLIDAQLQLAFIQGKIGKEDISLINIIDGLHARKEFITNIFQYASEKQKLLYLKKHPLFFDPLISFAIEQKKDTLINTSINMILQGKALVVDAMTENKNIFACENNIELKAAYQQHNNVCSKIADIAIAARFGSSDSQQNKVLDNLFELRDSLEASMSAVCANFEVKRNNNITFTEISEVLKSDEVIIDYMKFQSLDDDSVYNYCGYTLNNSGEKQFIYIGSTLHIDSLIKAFNNEIRNSQSLIYSQAASYAESRLNLITSQLYALLVKPFENMISKNDKIFISPDAMLNLFPFELLTDSLGNYLIESHEISYVSSGRDLLKFNKSTKDVDGIVLFANPDFDYDFEKEKLPKQKNLFSSLNFSVGQSRREKISCIGNDFSSLSYSINECNSILDILKKKNKKFSVQEFYRENASVINFRNFANPPQILHLSTHGFFCGDSSGNSMSHPLLRSGLVLAGANRSHENRAIDDGILTALEVTGLNLVGTELVTLSACETGMGETVSGEGVFGLRRAFQIAGAKSILMSMWKIPDKETSLLMTKFYDKLFSGKSKQQSLRESALEILEHSRATLNHGHPYLWGGFILTGNPN